MAIWQCNFIVIPKTVFDRDNFNVERFIDEEGFFDDELCWLSEPTKVDFFYEIVKILPKSKSWSNDIILFGNQDSNRLEIYKNEEDIVISVSFRVDYTSEYEDFLRLIISFVEMKNLAILDENFNLLDNNFITISSQIENSDQRVVFEKLNDKNE